MTKGAINLRCGDATFAENRLYVMGVVNVTPDSFSDGGAFLECDHAVAHAERLFAEGADVVDIGGVATSPHLSLTERTSEGEEIARVLPVIRELVRRGHRRIAVDTMRASVAQAALDEGASWINDQSAGLHDHAMPCVMTKACAVVLMHNGGGPSGVDAGNSVVYRDVMDDVLSFFRRRIEALNSVGVKTASIIVDPGVGFGKGLADSLTIINNMHRLHELETANLLGLSRKSFLFPISGIKNPAERDFASLGAHAAAMLSGTHILRTHNVRATVEMARVFAHCLEAKRRAAHENLH